MIHEVSPWLIVNTCIIVESPICSYISLTSYLLHHAHRSSRSSLYARLNLLVLRILLEDQALCKRLISDETKAFVRLCRQKPPHLPVVRTKRQLLTGMIDAVVDGINHNLRKKLDVGLYRYASPFPTPFPQGPEENMKDGGA